MDAWAIIWKEWRELIGQRGIRGKTGILLNMAVFGVALPLQTGRAWIESPLLLAMWSWVPMFLVSTVIADAFAGERERHTLETLLASRLSDRSILFGKMGAAIGYAGLVTIASLLLGLVTVNVSLGRQGLIFFSPSVVTGMLIVGLLGAVFVAAGGTLISLRSATVRQAVQTLGGAIMVLLFGPMLAFKALPAAWKQQWHLDAVAMAQVAVVAVGVLAAIDVALVALTLARFKRARLIVS